MPDTLEGGWVSAYLVIGDSRAVLIDSGFGKENIREFASCLTDKPLDICALTHGHPDHAGGIRYFERVLGEKKALDTVVASIIERGASVSETITDHSMIDLGGRILEVLVLEGHSPGSVAFLDRKEALLFTGDNIGDRNRRANADGGMLWYMKTPDEQPSLLVFMRNLAKLLVCGADYRKVCWGHGDEMLLNGEIVGSFMIAALKALNGDVDQQAEQEINYDGTPKFKRLEHKRVSQEKNARILYDKRFLYAEG